MSGEIVKQPMSSVNLRLLPNAVVGQLGAVLSPYLDNATVAFEP